ncbi:MAG: hypothetical protein JWM16_1104 [Verrucomicrobiales bacterium]|nr:hypothetical protein [Verrucomicrobiales bacterium]
MRSIFDSLCAAIENNEPVALALISGVKGSSPQKKGAKALFFADGRMEGTLGGGCLEAEVRERARIALLNQKPASFDLILDHDFGWDDGLICGGKVSGLILPGVAAAHDLWQQLARRQSAIEWGVRHDCAIGRVNDSAESGWLYRETVAPATALWIAGAGHVAQAVAPLGLNLDFAVTVFDDRASLANHQFFPADTRLRVDAWTTLLAEPMPVAPAFGLILTRGHQHDAMVLQSWVQKPFAFLGMIGSQRKKRLIFSHFIEEKIATEAQLSQVACPVGLDIQAASVPEIAISIIAQLVQNRAALASTTASR